MIDRDDEDAPQTRTALALRLDSIDARLSSIELMLLDISAALVNQGYTLKGHLESHAADAGRTRLRVVDLPPPKEPAE